MSSTTQRQMNAQDVIAALGYIPAQQGTQAGVVTFNGRAGTVALGSADVSTALNGSSLAASVSMTSSTLTGGTYVDPTIQAPRLARRTISGASTSIDTVGATDTAIMWNTSVAATKTEIIPSALLANDGQFLIIADEIGNAGTHPIVIRTFLTGTIANSGSYTISTNFGAVRLLCDFSATNWVVV